MKKRVLGSWSTMDRETIPPRKTAEDIRFPLIPGSSRGGGASAEGSSVSETGRSRGFGLFGCPHLSSRVWSSSVSGAAGVLPRDSRRAWLPDADLVESPGLPETGSLIPSRSKVTPGTDTQVGLLTLSCSNAG